MRIESGIAIAQIEQRRAVRNQFGSVHEGAICSLIALVAGLGTDATVPRSMRWFPKAMSVTYLRKASGRLTAMARVPSPTNGEAQELVAAVDVRNAADETVVRAEVTMWVTPRPLA